MLSEVMVNHLVIREALNGAAFPLSLALTLAICFYLASMFASYGRGWTRQPGVSTACALAWLFLAETCRAGSVWFFLQAGNDGRRVSESTTFYLNCLLAASAVILVLSLLRCTYLFTPPRLGNAPWIVAILAATAFVSLSLAL